MENFVVFPRTGRRYCVGPAVYLAAGVGRGPIGFLHTIMLYFAVRLAM